MARIKNNFVNISGKLGNGGFRTVNGRTFLVKLPERKGPRMDEKSVMIRNKFSLAIKLVTAIKKNPLLLLLWKSFSRCTRGEIYKHVYPFLQETDFSSVKLLPEGGFVFSLDNFSYINRIFSFVVNPLVNSGIWPQNEVYISMHAVFICSYDTDVMKEKFICTGLSSCDLLTNTDQPLTFNLQLSSALQQSLSGYASASLLVCLVTSDMNRNPVKYSDTIFVEVK